MEELTQIELEVARLLCDGLNNDEIAKRLFRSVFTINGYREEIRRKTKSKTALQAVVKLIKEGIL
jgi:DNA-binding NarL/FixJ family response regulator